MMPLDALALVEQPITMIKRTLLQSLTLFQAVAFILAIDPLAFGFSQTVALSKKDKSFLIEDALEHELKGQGASEPDTVLYLSTKRIGAEFLPSSASARLLILSPDEIKDMISREEKFAYLQLYKLIVNAQTAKVILIENKYQKGKWNDYAVVTHHYRRRSGKWVRTGADGYLAPRI